MPAQSKITDQELKKLKQEIESDANGPVRAWQIKDKLAEKNVVLDESTIRGRFIEMGESLSGGITMISTPKPTQKTIPTVKSMPTPPLESKPTPGFSVDKALKRYIPNNTEFDNYIERSIDKRLAIHYDAGKCPLTQGKQGTGKTFSHRFYAFKKRLPFFLFSCHEDLKLQKLFGERTIANGSVRFQEGMLAMAIQSPSVILFDEINAVSNTNSFQFHDLLQERQILIKDADDGKGKLYKLHSDCRIGFAQNPKSAKYIGGNIKPSNFLGRCTFITYPEFSKPEIQKAVEKRFPQLKKDEIAKFTQFYFACIQTIEAANIPVDISIRQLNNVIDLYINGLPLQEAIEDGMTSILEAASQPKAKEGFYRLAQGVWEKLMEKSRDENVGSFSSFVIAMGEN